MNIISEIVTTAAGTGIVIAIGFVYSQIMKINERLARIEEHLGINTVTQNKK